jgi:ATP-binding cassette subfamily C (CFTR/MRP) protein 4
VPGYCALHVYAYHLNYFSEASLLSFEQIGLSLLAVVIVVSVLNVWLLIPTVLMFIIFYALRQYYLSTSRSLKRLEAISKYSVFFSLTL